MSFAGWTVVRANQPGSLAANPLPSFRKPDAKHPLLPSATPGTLLWSFRHARVQTVGTEKVRKLHLWIRAELAGEDEPHLRPKVEERSVQGFQVRNDPAVGIFYCPD